jgi:hypothetical protein
MSLGKILFDSFPREAQESVKEKFDKDQNLLKQLMLIPKERRKKDIIKICRTCGKHCSSFWVRTSKTKGRGLVWKKIIEFFPGLKDLDSQLYGVGPKEEIMYAPTHSCTDTEEYLLIYLLTGRMLSMNNNIAPEFNP